MEMGRRSDKPLLHGVPSDSSRILLDRIRTNPDHDVNMVWIRLDMGSMVLC